MWLKIVLVALEAELCREQHRQSHFLLHPLAQAGVEGGGCWDLLCKRERQMPFNRRMITQGSGAPVCLCCMWANSNMCRWIRERRQTPGVMGVRVQLLQGRQTPEVMGVRVQLLQYKFWSQCFAKYHVLIDMVGTVHWGLCYRAGRREAG